MKLNELQKLLGIRHIPTTPEEQQAFYAYLRTKGIDPGSFYQEMEMSSRYVDTHRDVSFSNSMINLHSHTFYEVLYCRNTCGAEYLVGTERYRLVKGDIIFIPPGISHRPLLPADMAEPYRRDVLWISAELIQGLKRLFPDHDYQYQASSYLLRTAGTKWEYLGEMFHNGVMENEQKLERWDSAILGNTILLLVHLHRAIHDYHSPTLKAEKPELLDQVMAYVESHLQEHITLADTAKHFFVSESTISQTFRRKMGVSFYRCVTQRRLIAAKELIHQGVPLERVNEQVGFSDYSTFYRAFKQEYGISPRQYRKLQESAEQPML